MRIHEQPRLPCGPRNARRLKAMKLDDDKFDYADFRAGPSEYAKATAAHVPDYIKSAIERRKAELEERRKV